MNQSKTAARVRIALAAVFFIATATLHFGKMTVLSARAAEKDMFRVVSATPQPMLDEILFHPAISRTEPFAGGDSAYSIRISKRRSAWFFGDSFFGEMTNGSRKDCSMDRNAVSIQDPQNSVSPAHFYHRKPAFFAVFDDTNQALRNRYYWPGDGFTKGGKLYLFMHETMDAPDEPPPFKFKALADHLFVVENPENEPDVWRWHEIHLPAHLASDQMGIACLLRSGYAYIYMINTKTKEGFNQTPTGLTRLKLSELTLSNKSANFEWLTTKGWQKNLSAAPLRTLWQNGVSEMSVCRIKGLPGYFAFYLPFGSKAIMMRHADQPEGPWGEQTAVYELPDVGKDVIYYSVKAHRQYCQAKRGRENKAVILTYCSNATNQARLLGDAKVYFPTAIKIKLAAAKN